MSSFFSGWEHGTNNLHTDGRVSEFYDIPVRGKEIILNSYSQGTQMQWSGEKKKPKPLSLEDHALPHPCST